MIGGSTLHLLVINSGSSSIKFSIFATDAETPRSRYEGEVTGIGSGHASFVFHAVEATEKPKPESMQAEDPTQAIARIVDALAQPGVPKVDAVGYRVVHPGEKLHSHVRIDDAVMRDLDDAVVFAPLHDPSAIRIIREMMQRFPELPHFACFDTVFHQTMPEVATTYAIPTEYREHGVRRYGFHGLSCESIVEQMRAAKFAVPKRMVIAHLGSGCSVTALVEGASIDTSMGLTPTGGVVMGTRPGDLDPGLVLYLLRDMKGDRTESFAAVEKLINHSSGVAALSGVRNDMKATRETAADGNERAQLAIAVFTRSVRKAIGSYAWLMGGVDAIVFTGGIGEHDAKTRSEVVSGLEEVGVILNAALNEAEDRNSHDDIYRLKASDSKTDILLIPAKEDWMIARHMQTMLGS
ncbi:MAG: acetate/propionate family kinase [Edaphobacter sp.]|uniref:acetate/propionate family kinase n=1 Tax=Edaphobacter sp. TaxID=1934404 RepID=UPI0023A352FE|nr:acetate/propionate family kinase [Edaphobacter sp.]MDE1178101.1 acetate/propionate family kinase [Edaphobacter sp.]